MPNEILHGALPTIAKSMNKLSQEILELLNKSSTQNFLEAARQFIKLVENRKDKKELFYTSSHKALTNLYSAGLNLESVKLEYSNEDSNFKGVDKKNLIEQNNNLISNLGMDSTYWEVFDPIYQESKEPTQGWLVDDFADIYSDLKEEIYKIDEVATDESIEDALWSLKHGFNHHWGNHCIDAIRAMHYM
jgi:hypothetical protein